MRSITAGRRVIGLAVSLVCVPSKLGSDDVASGREALEVDFEGLIGLVGESRLPSMLYASSRRERLDTDVLSSCARPTDSV